MASEVPGEGGMLRSVAADMPNLTLHDEPTESHALAVADHDEKGVAQQYHTEPEIKDLGWHEDVEKVPTPLVAGLPNEELWALIRRFNKQMYHVKAIKYRPPGGLDLNISDEEEFSPDKLRANLERLYMTVIVGMVGAAKHIARLRSWNEYRRTAAFCATYFLAWILNVLMPVLFSTMVALIVYPPARNLLFPPAPLALVDRKTGGLQKPSAGMLGSDNTLTGAPEKHHGEAVEQEAHNFVNSFAAIGLSAAAGKHPQDHSHEANRALDKSVPDPTKLTAGSGDSSAGVAEDTKHDKTKQPMEAAMWEKARPVMRAVADVADGWERFSNALSPTFPFKDTARFRLAGLLVPAVAMALFLDPATLYRSSTFIGGGVFFGDPILAKGMAWLNRNFPDWPKYLDPRNHILYGVPTNAQLTLTLLRIGEANKAPLPPPPHSEQPPSAQPKAIHGDDIPLDASHEEVQDVIHPDPTDSQIPGNEHLDEQAKKPKHGRKVLASLKAITKAGVGTVLGTDRLKAQVGSEHAKMRLGVLPDQTDIDTSGPVDFKARYHGKKGHLYISTGSVLPPRLSFSTESNRDKADRHSTAFTVSIPDIRELKKVGGLGWKAKMIVGWAMDREVADGLEIVDAEGNTYAVTAIPLRDELFNRLVAMGGQKWESW